MSALKRSLSSVAVDTITTRFLLLFLFLLSIPLITVIIFSVSLIEGHMDEATNNRLLLSENLLDSALARTREDLALLGTVQRNAPKSGFAGICGRAPSVLCFHLDFSQNRLQTSAGTTMPLRSFPALAPDLAPVARQVLPEPHFYVRWQNRLYLMRKENDAQLPEQTPSVEAFRGYALDDAYLSAIYEQYAALKTEIWILSEPLDPKHPLWYARSPRNPYLIPARALLEKLRNQALMQPLTIQLDQSSFRVIQQPVYSPTHQRIARILHILPLTENKLLLQNYYLGIYIISVASLLFSVLLAMAAGRTITQPLLKLVRQVNTLSRENVMRDKDEVTVSGVYEIRQLGEAFNRMIQRLRQEHKMKDEFVATLTHDLKVPLLAEKQTLSYFKTGAYGPLSDEQGEVLEVLQSSNRSCLGLVNGLLEVYRYDSGEVSLIFESFNLPKLMEETVQELQSLAQEKFITLTVNSPVASDSSDALVYADRLEVKRVLHNLVSNAITNTPSHGNILCSITDSRQQGGDTVYKVSGFQYTTLKYAINIQDRLLVSIQDSGVGFSSEDLPNLFKQFAASRGRNPMSIGLGLYNCYQVIRAHHGVLWVETSEGEGSAVSFILPKSKQTAQDRRVYRDRRRKQRQD